jgi:hypothetical protein
LDPDRRRAISDFYREEFLRHLNHLELSGCLGDASDDTAARTCRRVIGDLDRLSCCSRFPAVAETLLQRFDLLTGLSQVDSRRGH